MIPKWHVKCFACHQRSMGDIGPFSCFSPPKELRSPEMRHRSKKKLIGPRNKFHFIVGDDFGLGSYLPIER